jgi:hypothetical protein
LFSIARKQNKLISRIIFQHKWELDEVGTEIMLDLWKNAKKFEKIISMEGFSYEVENIFAVIEFLKKKFGNGEIPSDYFTSHRLKLKNSTNSFLQYAFNFNTVANQDFGSLCGPFLKNYSNL